LGHNQILSVFASTAAGIPLYSCGGTVIPVMKELADMGVNKGAILAFLISGPATKISTLVLLTTMFKKGIVAVYFALSIVGAIVFGIAYHFFRELTSIFFYCSYNFIPSLKPPDKLGLPEFSSKS